MTKPRRLPLLMIPALLLVLVGAGCGAISSPQGWAAPVVVADTSILASLHRGKLSLYDSATKSAVWTFPPDTDKLTKLSGVYGTPVVTQDKSSVVFGAYNGHVYELSLADGKKQWEFNTGAGIVGSVAVDGERAYVGNSDGKIFALKLSGGGLAWSESLEPADRIWSTPTVDSGTVYVTSMNRKVYALKADSGQISWKNGDADGAITSTPALAGGRLFFGSFDEHLYALDAAQGTKVWRSNPAANNWYWSHTLVSDGMVYTGSLDGTVFAVDGGTGDVKWSKKLGGAIRGRPAIAGGVLVVVDRNGRANGFDPQTGAAKWDKPVELDSTSLGDEVILSDTVLVATNGGKGGTRVVQIDPRNGTTTDLLKP